MEDTTTGSGLGQMNASSSRTSPKNSSSSRGRVQRRPCDRCHSIKEKCRWPADDTNQCSRCIRLKYECYTRRPLVKAGRKAKLPGGNRMSLRRHHSRDNLHTQSPTPSTVSRNSSSPIEVLTPIDQGVQLHVHSKLTFFPDLNDLEVHLLEIMLNKDIEVDKYLIGPGFRDQHRQAFADYLKIGMPLLKDAFIACATDLVGNPDVRQLANDQHVGHKRAAAAIASLRVLDIRGICDLSTVLIFGAAVVTFAGHHSGDELLLCRHVLGLIKPLHDNDLTLIGRLGSDGTSFLICLLGTETTLCLFRCQIPSIKIRPHDCENLVDRFIGISAPLLPHFYDICELSNWIHRSSCRRGGVVSENALDRIEEAIQNWQPAVPNDFTTGHFTPADVVLMLAQSKVLRLAALLIMHRLRYAFGTFDGRGLGMSNDILHELDLVFRVTGRSLPFADLAYLVACFEITDPMDRKTALSQSYRVVDFSSRLRDEVEVWLTSWWIIRDTKTTPPIYWDDLGFLL